MREQTKRTVPALLIAYERLQNSSVSTSETRKKLYAKRMQEIIDELKRRELLEVTFYDYLTNLKPEQKVVTPTEEPTPEEEKSEPEIAPEEIVPEPDSSIVE